MDRDKASASLSTLAGPAVGLTMSARQWKREAVSKDINRTGSETGHLSSYSGGAKNGWSCTSILL